MNELKATSTRLLSGHVFCSNEMEGCEARMLAYGPKHWTCGGSTYLEDAIDDGAVYVHQEHLERERRCCDWIPALDLESDITYQLDEYLSQRFPSRSLDDFLEYFALEGEEIYEHSVSYRRLLKVYGASMLRGSPVYFDYGDARALIQLFFGRADVMRKLSVSGRSKKQGIYVGARTETCGMTYWTYEFRSPFLTFTGVMHREREEHKVTKQLLGSYVLAAA